MTTDVREQVRERYAEAAVSLSAGCGCGCDCESIGCCGEEATTLFGQGLYGADERAGLPENAVTASLGCGNPLALVELNEGETVLDLGSGGGIDVLLSAKRVGPTGTVYGLDMTDEMLELARENAAKAGATNVHFLKGLIEEIPLDDASVDVVISNCVVNLSPEKDKVLAEIARVLRPGGRDRDLRRRRRGSAVRGRPRRAREPRRVHRRRAVCLRVPRRARRASASWTSRSSSPTRSRTGCTARWCVRASQTDAPSSFRRQPASGTVGRDGVRRRLRQSARRGARVHAGRPPGGCDDAPRPATHARHGL